jgi:hypothetical protein
MFKHKLWAGTFSAAASLFLFALPAAANHVIPGSVSVTANCQGFTITGTGQYLYVSRPLRTLYFDFTVNGGTQHFIGNVPFPLPPTNGSFFNTPPGSIPPPPGYPPYPGQYQSTVTQSFSWHSFGFTPPVNGGLFISGFAYVGNDLPVQGWQTQSGPSTDPNGNPTNVPVLFSDAISVPGGCAKPPVCTIPPIDSAIPGDKVSWNKFDAPSGAHVWIHAHIGSPTGVPTNTVTTVAFTNVTFVLNGRTYDLPNGELIFDPSAPSTPSTSFSNSGWATIVNPRHLSDEIFFDGSAVPVDSNITGGGKATFNFTVESSDNRLAFDWQWSAAVFTYWPGGNAFDNQARILPYHAGEHAGTPLNPQIQHSLIQGPRGGGGSNFTGSWSGTGHGQCPGALPNPPNSNR